MAEEPTYQMKKYKDKTEPKKLRDSLLEGKTTEDTTSNWRKHVVTYESPDFRKILHGVQWERGDSAVGQRSPILLTILQMLAAATEREDRCLFKKGRAFLSFQHVQATSTRSVRLMIFRVLFAKFRLDPVSAVEIKGGSWVKNSHSCTESVPN